MKYVNLKEKGGMMKMKTREHAEKLLRLVKEGTSPFHVTASVERQLSEAGFEKLSMGKD